MALGVFFSFIFVFLSFLCSPEHKTFCFIEFFSKTIKNKKLKNLLSFLEKSIQSQLQEKLRFTRHACLQTQKKNKENSSFKKKLFAKDLRFTFFLNFRFKIQMPQFESRREKNVTFIFCKMTIFSTLFLQIRKNAKMYKC